MQPSVSRERGAIPECTAPPRLMINVLEFDEKKFWIVLFSIVARREATREDAIDQQSADEPPKQPEERDWRRRIGREEPADAV